ncbi:hypothetical protein AVEN_76273-1 [Araneus ventricosus]|uniref:Secreted protein n=1 Tax=Araneus ventricosus TaxID=182803 RepID=A0A4Y2I974_ARAVE|nr:hypothetical protein AVEN_76273-1 [Araneus ventricosus]
MQGTGGLWLISPVVVVLLVTSVRDDHLECGSFVRYRCQSCFKFDDCFVRQIILRFVSFSIVDDSAYCCGFKLYQITKLKDVASIKRNGDW